MRGWAETYMPSSALISPPAGPQEGEQSYRSGKTHWRVDARRTSPGAQSSSTWKNNTHPLCESRQAVALQKRCSILKILLLPHPHNIQRKGNPTRAVKRQLGKHGRKMTTTSLPIQIPQAGLLANSTVTIRRLKFQHVSSETPSCSPLL